MNAVRKVKMAGSPGSFFFGGARMVVCITGEQADEQLSLIEGVMPPGSDSGLHVRLREDETIHLVAGELELTVGGQRTMLRPGESYFIPRNMPYRVRNLGMAEARALLMNVPGVSAGKYESLILVPPYQEGEAAFNGKPPVYKRPVHKREQDTYMFFGVPTVLHLAGIETGSELSLMESFMGVDGDSGLHLHANEDECIYVLDGELELSVCDSLLVLRAGCSYFIPRHCAHRLRSRKAARVMHWYTPGTLDPFVRMAGIRIKGPNDVGPVYPSPEQIGPILLLSEEYDFQMLVPPGA
ncbi:MAG: cupin domain-containing protein [Bacteroidetes bacterium]|nr:cupin domain-containing protein [Bacteroidota bacterium]